MSAARRLALATVGTLCALVGGLVLASAPALAAAPEAPALTVEAPAKAVEATLNGVLNPGKKGVAGTYETGAYEFLYNEGSGCEGGSVTKPGMSLGGGEEKLPAETLTGLRPNAGYTVCLRVTTAGGSTLSPPVKFVTALENPETGAASPIGVTTATLNGVLSPAATLAGEPGTYEFRYRQSARECQGGELGEEKATPATAAAGSAKEAATASVTALAAGTQYTFCPLERNAAGEMAVGLPVTFRTRGAGIAEEQALGIETSAATLQASIDPNESNTSYHFEYDTSPYTSITAHGTSLPVPSKGIGAGTSPVTVSVGLTGLQPGTTYHYRVVATDEIETFYGPDQIFTTSTPPGGAPETCPNEQRRSEQPYGLRLPDCRAYELVSPLNSEGQDATDVFEAVGFIPSSPRAAVSGEAVTYTSLGSFANPKGAPYVSQLLSRRGPAGWSTQDISPRQEPAVTTIVAPYREANFTPELMEGIVLDNASLTGETVPGELALYLADFASGTYQRLTPKEGILYTSGVSTDLSHVLMGEYNVGGELGREWGNGKVTIVTVGNGGEEIHSAFNDGRDSWHYMSADGSRVYFTNDNKDNALDERVNTEQLQSPMNGEGCTVSGDACTIEVSASQRGVPDPHGPQSPTFFGANAEGSKVFFTSTAELTEDAYTGPDDNAANLYEYELSSEPGKRGRLTDLTVDDAGDGAAVLGVTQMSEDGSYVYFVAEGDLAGDAVAGAPNLYVSHDGGAPTFIATLARDDNPDWGGPEVQYSPASTQAVVTPDGTRLAFISERSLTGYDNEQAERGECENYREGESGENRNETGRCLEIYLYDAEANRLVCASCNPSGARPIGPSSIDNVSNGASQISQYRPRNLVEGGALFFNSQDALVPHASDGRKNVYEYEDGHVHAISDVAGGFESVFVDASANGDNVFFATADQLLPEDTSNNVMVYDARISGGFPVTVAPPPCNNGDSCKPPPTPQPALFGAPASATFSGAGNLTPEPSSQTPKITTKITVRCKQGRKLSHGKCVKRSKPSKKRAKAKRTNRRAGR